MYPTVGNHATAYAAELHLVWNHLSDRAVCSLKIPKFLICESYYISKVVLLSISGYFHKTTGGAVHPWAVTCPIAYVL